MSESSLVVISPPSVWRVQLLAWLYAGTGRLVVTGMYLVVASSALIYWGQQAGLAQARLLDEAIFALFALLAAGMVLASGRLYVTLTPLWLLAFSALGLYSSMLNEVSLPILWRGYLLAAKPLLIFWVYQLLPLDKDSAETIIRGLRRFLTVLTVAAVAYALILELGLGVNPVPGATSAEMRFGITPARSFFFHQSHMASFMTIAAAFFASHALLSNSRRSVILLFVAILGVIVTARLKSLLLLPVILVVQYGLIRLRQTRIRLRTLLTGVLISLAAIVAIAIFTALLWDVVELRLIDGSTNVRSALLKYAFVINSETYGLGAGLGMFGSAVSVEYQYSPLYYRFGISNMTGATPVYHAFITDQWWAWYLGEVGYWGTAVFIGCLLWILWRLHRLAGDWRGRHVWLSTWIYTALAALLFAILSGYASVYLTAPPTGYLVMSLCGLAFALDRGLRYVSPDPGGIQVANA